MPYHIGKSLATLNRGNRGLLLLCVAAQLCLGEGGRLNGGNAIPQARIAYAPSTAFFDGRIFLAWRGAGSPDMSEDDQHLYYATLDGENWSLPQSLSANKSMFGPVMAATENQLFIAWHGEGNLFSGTGDSRIYFASLQRGGEVRYWGAVPGAKSAGSPGLAVYQGRVYVGWRSTGNITLGLVAGNRHWINHVVFDPSSGQWQDAPSDGINIVHANSTSGPAFAPVGTKLYALWRGTGSVTFYGPNSDPGDPYIYYGFYDGKNWSTLQLPLPRVMGTNASWSPGAVTSWSPGAVDWMGNLFVGWRGDQARGDVPSDSTLSFGLKSRDDQWEEIDLFNGESPGSAFSPSMVVDGRSGRLWVFWRGEFDRQTGIDDQKIYSASFDRLGSAPRVGP